MGSFFTFHPRPLIRDSIPGARSKDLGVRASCWSLNVGV